MRFATQAVQALSNQGPSTSPSTCLPQALQTTRLSACLSALLKIAISLPISISMDRPLTQRHCKTSLPPSSSWFHRKQNAEIAVQTSSTTNRLQIAKPEHGPVSRRALLLILSSKTQQKLLPIGRDTVSTILRETTRNGSKITKARKKSLLHAQFLLT